MEKYNEKRVKLLFARDKDLQEVFATSDGYVFFGEQAAIGWVNTQRKKGVKVDPHVKKFSRSDFEQELEAKEKAKEEAEAKAKADAEAKAKEEAEAKAKADADAKAKAKK